MSIDADRGQEGADAAIDDYVLLGEEPFALKQDETIACLARAISTVAGITSANLMNMDPRRLEELRGQIDNLRITLGDFSTRLYVAATLGPAAAEALGSASDRVFDAFHHRDTAIGS